ncbi:MAG: hypothetical protein HYZ01_03385 [Ignavibacteriales bacterium]|nr:hypothetical protein [Ignavibacteriales bacterium]
MKIFLLALVLCCAPVRAQHAPSWRIDAGLTYSAFQQQVKAMVGDPRGERLVNETQFGMMLMGTSRVWETVSAGLFLQFDRGNRHAARFDGFDPQTGKTVTREKIGGDYNEFWAGPFLRVQWKQLFGELGYGLIGFRNDDARDDLPSETGDASGSLQLSARIAWLAGVGAAVEIFEDVDLVLRMEYRLRYYDKREGEPFKDMIEHGTQNFTPFFGVAWRF